MLCQTSLQGNYESKDEVEIGNCNRTVQDASQFRNAHEFVPRLKIVGWIAAIPQTILYQQIVELRSTRRIGVQGPPLLLSRSDEVKSNDHTSIFLLVL